MRRSIASRPLLLLAAPLLALLMLSCGNAGADSADADTLEVWHGWNAEETEVFREIVADFEHQWLEQSGRPIRVEIKYVAFGDMFTKLRTAALGKLTPDVAFVDSIKVTDLAFGNALVPLDETEVFRDRYATIDGARQEFVNASFRAGVVNRRGEVHLYALPVQTTTIALFWNREMFRRNAARLREAGLDPGRPPRDWDELTAYGRVLTDPADEVYGFGMWGSFWFNFAIFNMYGVEFVQYDESGRASPALDNERGRAALERILAIVNSGMEGGAWRRSTLPPDAGFLNRKYAMVLDGPWRVEGFNNAGLDFDIGLVPAPTEEEIRRLGLQSRDPAMVEKYGQLGYSSSNVGGQSGVIMRTCEDIDAAFAFLEYFTSEAVQRHWASQLGQIPVRRAAWEELDMSKFPFLVKFMDQLRLAERIPQVPRYEILESNIYNPEINLLLQGRQTPEQMLRNMEKAMQEQILSKINEAIGE